jgi:hypothetical protein
MAVKCYYNPAPTRVWSRVQAPCTYPGGDYTTQYVYIPIINKIVPIGDVVNEFNVLKKGNILQYKNNSSNLTSRQRYSQIAKGMWTNRTTTYASQTQTSSQPNTKSLKQVNYTTVTLNGVPINSPVTCKKPIIIPTPSSLPSGTGQPVVPAPPIPPLPEPVDSSLNAVIPNITPPPAPPAPEVIPDGGSLICTITQNICTGEILKSTSVNYCTPTSASDVPGPIIDLCYNDGFLPTYYPRQNLTQASSGGNKFPEGYKGFVSAVYFTTGNQG